MCSHKSRSLYLKRVIYGTHTHKCSHNMSGQDRCRVVADRFNETENVNGLYRIIIDVKQVKCWQMMYLC